ncbi:MAG: hypothetical protein UW95_C0013G0002 [Parcubacteria group bacterium GW2011_GWC1_45_14]|nr:MAG: hypothetical protein UW95_C0013G0002 [Parcubacteria group bacterium GW2011_GWC1_45_14]
MQKSKIKIIEFATLIYIKIVAKRLRNFKF